MSINCNFYKTTIRRSLKIQQIDKIPYIPSWNSSAALLMILFLISAAASFASGSLWPSVLVVILCKEDHSMRNPSHHCVCITFWIRVFSPIIMGFWGIKTQHRKHTHCMKELIYWALYTEPYDQYTCHSYPSYTSDHVTYLNPLLVAGPLDDPLDIDVRYMDVLWGDFPNLHNLLYLSDRDAARLTHRRVEVTSSLPTNIVLQIIWHFLASFHHIW